MIAGLLAALVSVFGCSRAGTQAPAEAIPSGRRLEAQISRDVDGDTIAVEFAGGDEVDVRLIGIDTPEEVKPDYPTECGSRPAAKSMSGLVDGGEATLVTDPTQQRFDRYGRLLAYVYVNGVDVNLAQVRRGWAEVYVFEGRDFEQLDSFRRAAAAAAGERRGVWNACGGAFHSAESGSG